MKSLEYFIKAEKAHESLDTSDWNGFEPIEDPEWFLSRRYFSKFSKTKLSEEELEAIKTYKLSDVEVVVLRCFLADLSCCFRDDYFKSCYGKVPETAIELQNILDGVIQKAPKHTGEVLYRHLVDEDRTNFRVGEIFTPGYSLTTTIQSWGYERNCYVITPLPTNETRAHDLYKIRNHGNECQVNFLNGTSFEIMSIEEKLQGRTKFINMRELCYDKS